MSGGGEGVRYLCRANNVTSDDCAVFPGQGMQSEEGRRRSTRQRHRPLEWWRQETKIYTREHKSISPFPQPGQKEKRCSKQWSCLPCKAITQFLLRLISK